MPFLTGNFGFTRFSVHGKKPRQFDESHLERLADRKAGWQRVVAGDAAEWGWAAGESVLDTDFTLIKNVYSNHLNFDFWQMTNKLPGDLLKAYYVTDLKALSKNNPSGFPSNLQKREAKESSRDRLELQAKDGRFKKRKIIPVLWDSIRNEVLIATSSPTTLDQFARLFIETFEANLFQSPNMADKLVRMSAGRVAEKLDKGAKNERLSPFVPGLTPDVPDWHCGDNSPPDFLGNEFLLWLWWQVEEVNDTIKLTDGSECACFFSGGMKVSSPGGHGDDTMNAEVAIRLPEARTAIRNGMLPRKAAITTHRNGDQVKFILQAESLAVSSCKIVASEEAEEKDPRANIERRLGLVRDFSETLELLFATFVSRRISGYWSSELKDIQAWLGATVAA